MSECGLDFCSELTKQACKHVRISPNGHLVESGYQFELRDIYCGELFGRDCHTGVGIWERNSNFIKYMWNFRASLKFCWTIRALHSNR